LTGGDGLHSRKPTGQTPRWSSANDHTAVLRESFFYLLPAARCDRAAAASSVELQNW